MNRNDYVFELRRRLAYRAVPKQRVNEIVAEVEDHLAQSGEDPLESFGPPDRYAARLVRGRWHTLRFVVGLAAGAAAGGLGWQVAEAFQHGEPMVTVTGSHVIAVAGILPGVLVAVLPVVHNRFPRPNTQLLLLVAVALFVACAATWAGNATGLYERDLFTVGRSTGLAAAALLATVAVTSGAGPYLRRSWRDRRAASRGDRD